MYTLIVKNLNSTLPITYKGFKTQEEAYRFFLTYFDDSYNLEIVKECEESDETCWQSILFSLYLYLLVLFGFMIYTSRFKLKFKEI